MNECESWTIKKADCQRIDAFELWCWRGLLRVPWTTGRSNQSIINEINPEYSLEELIRKLQYFGHLMQRADSLEKNWCLERLRAGGEEDDRGWDGWMASLTQRIWVWANSWRQWRTERGVANSRTRLKDQTTIICWCLPVLLLFLHLTFSWKIGWPKVNVPFLKL